MGEAKRRQKNGNSKKRKPVEVKIEKSRITSKWLVFAYILRERYVVSPFIKREDAESAAEEVERVFNSRSYESWRELRRGNRKVLNEAISQLTYEDDDEIIGTIF